MVLLDEHLANKSTQEIKVSLTAQTGFLPLIVKMKTKDLTSIYHVVRIPKKEAVTEVGFYM